MTTQHVIYKKRREIKNNACIKISFYDYFFHSYVLRFSQIKANVDLKLV